MKYRRLFTRARNHGPGVNDREKEANRLAKPGTDDHSHPPLTGLDSVFAAREPSVEALGHDVEPLQGGTV